jgi:hypothetical protein
MTKNEMGRGDFGGNSGKKPRDATMKMRRLN